MLRFFILILVLGLTTPALAQKPLVMNITPSQPGMIAAAVIKAAYAKLNIPLELKFFPIKRGLFDANNGIVDGESCRMAGLQNEVPNLIQIEIPVSFVQGVAITNDPQICIRNREDLKALRVGVFPGMRLSDKAVEGLPHVTKGDWSQLFELLYMDRLDVILTYDGIEKTQQGRDEAKRLRVCRPPQWRFPLYHYLNRNHANLVPRITNVLKEMERSGEMQQIQELAQESEYKFND